jgi:hypothetical protein
MIKTMHIGDFKAKFSEVVELIKQGVTIQVVKGRAGEVVGYFGKRNEHEKKIKRTLGFFSDEGLDIKKEDVEWSEKELEEMGL